jgi:hypothetical protein
MYMPTLVSHRRGPGAPLTGAPPPGRRRPEPSMQGSTTVIRLEDNLSISENLSPPC